MPEDIVLRFVIPGELAGQRVDRAVAALSGGELTRTRVRRLIEDGNVFVDGAETKPSSKVAEGQSVEVFVPPPPPREIVPQDISLDVVHEDEDLIIVNKPSGMVVHPGAGNPDGTLVNALAARCAIRGVGEAMRPGIVHRLDKDTSGLMVVAKNEKAHALLSAMFATKSIVRRYVALVYGTPPPEGVISTAYGRSRRDRKKFTGRTSSTRRAVTRYRRLVSFEKAGLSLVELSLETGRTHQIRVHMSEAGWPLVGDAVYGRRHPSPGLRDLLSSASHTLLHSRTMEFTHPIRGSWMSLSVEPEPVFKDILAKLETYERT